MSESINPMPLQVDIVSDVVCPWCIIGYKQLQQALAQLPGQFDVTVQWHPFELNPQMPPEGQDLREHLVQKYGTTPEQSKAARTRLSSLGESLGFTFDYFDGMRMANTFHAHQLLHWASEQGCQSELKLALFEAFFSRREDVGDDRMLAEIASRVGLSSVTAMEVLDDKRYGEVVRKEQAVWLDREVHGVPAFVFNEQYMVPGAQDAETLVRVLTRLRDKR